MAKTTRRAAQAAPPDDAAPSTDPIDPDAMYVIRLRRAVSMTNGTVMRPRDAEIRVRGRIVQAIPADALISRTKV